MRSLRWSILALFLPSALFLLALGGCASKPSPDGGAAVPPREEAPRLDFGLSPDFQSRTIHGVDFDLDYISSGRRKSSLLVYIGFHPTLRSREQKAENLKREEGRVGSIPVEWTRWQEEKVFHSEAAARGLYGAPSAAEPRGASALIVHIFISAPSAAEVAWLEAASVRLKLKPGK